MLVLCHSACRIAGVDAYHNRGIYYTTSTKGKQNPGAHIVYLRNTPISMFMHQNNNQLCH